MDYEVFPSGLKYCRVHNITFNDSCSKCNPHSLIAHGESTKRFVKSRFEQGAEQGVTLSNKETQRVSSVDFLSSAVRSHAFRFVISLDNPPNWKDRRKILESKGFKVEKKGGIGNVLMVCFNGFKCWLADKSIIVYFPSWKQYFVDEARFGFNFALADLRDLLDDLAQSCDSSFVIDGSYRFKCSGHHHALIHNALARMFNRKKERLQVFDKNGVLWLLVDDSHPDGLRLSELETVRKDESNIDDNDLVKEDYNDLLSTKLTRGAIASNMNALIEDRKFWAEHQRSHVASIQELGSSVRSLTDVVFEIKNSLRSSPEGFSPLPTLPLFPSGDLLLSDIQLKYKELAFLKRRMRK